MGKKKTKIDKFRPRKPKFQAIAPSQQLIGHGDVPPPLPASQEEIAYRKRLQGALLMVSQELLKEHQEEIVARAIERLKAEESKIK